MPLPVPQGGFGNEPLPFQAEAAGPSVPTAARPWYMNFDLPTLEQTLRERPDLAQLIPDEVINQFRNEFFLENPQFQARLSNERRATFGVGALGPKREPQGGFGNTLPVTQPGEFVPGPGVDTRSAAGGDRTGTIVRTPTGASLREGGQQVPLPPGLGAPIAGQQTPLYRSQGNLPIFSAQALARLAPGERQLLGTTVNRTGGRAEDYFEQQRKLFSTPQGGGFRFR